MNRRGFIIGALIAVVALAVTYWLAKVAHPFGLQAWIIKEQSLRVFVWSVRDLFKYSVLTPAFVVVIALTLTSSVCSRRNPIRRSSGHWCGWCIPFDRRRNNAPRHLRSGNERQNAQSGKH